MAIFDAGPLVSLLLDEPGADAAIGLLSATRPHHICAINHAEVIERVARYGRTGTREIADWFDVWTDYDLGVVPLSVERARRAAAIRADHYHARRVAVSLADCCAIALAEERDDALATNNRAMLAVARGCGVEVIALPDSTGTVPD